MNLLFLFWLVACTIEVKPLAHKHATKVHHNKVKPKVHTPTTPVPVPIPYPSPSWIDHYQDL